MSGDTMESKGEIHLKAEEKILEDKLEKQIGIMSECFYLTMKEFIRLQNIIYSYRKRDKDIS
jgi:hypothetical protein